MLLRPVLLTLLLCLASGAGAQTGLPPTDLTLTQDRLIWDGQAARFRLQPDLALPSAPASAPVIDPADTGPGAGGLRRLAAQHLASGLAGVFYDNRDRDHSSLPPDLFPQLTRLRYGPDLRAQQLDYGLAETLLLPGPAFGNSSTAVTSGPAPRSLPRLAMTTPDGPMRAWQTYAANAVYVYPEHRDHDAADLFPGNWPYMLISQGSSGSDRPFLRAIGLILAALPPATREKAAADGLIAPTVQMVFRRAQTGVRNRAAYLSGSAHPTVFAAEAIDEARMVALAASLAPDELPPMVLLQVLTEDFSASAGLAGQSERLYDTPSAIARVWRSPAWTREMTVTAVRTRDPNGRPLVFTWVLLRGDPDRVRITPYDARGLTARIAIDWQDAGPVSPRDPRLTSRVDIGVFASNGRQDSAPAFLSITFPTHEARRYAPGPDGVPRLAEVDYDARGRGQKFDRLLYWSAPWRDLFRHGPDGALLGWTRVGTDSTVVEGLGAYGADGQLTEGGHVDYILSPPRPGPTGEPTLAMRVTRKMPATPPTP